MGRASLARIAALLIIVSQVIAMWLAVDPTGESAIVFSFVGTPLLGIGLVLALTALAMRRAQEARERSN
jgi:hypothetical protein